MEITGNMTSPRTTFLKGACILLLAALQLASASAQSATSRIEGTVIDPFGAVLPKALLKLTDQDKHRVVYSGAADSVGHYLMDQIQPGNYILTVDSKGFQHETITEITASVGQTITLDVHMKVGDVSASVTVNASMQEQLERATSSVSTLITPSEVDDLPLPNRDVTQLLSLIGGISYGGDSTQLNTYQMSINGSRSLGTETLLDGMSILLNTDAGMPPLPSPDALSQARFSTLNAPAEYGHTSGAVLTMVTKSGADAFHGRLYTLLRNEAFNANGFMNNLRDLQCQCTTYRRQKNRYEQFGAVFSGPLVIPKLYNGHGRTFYMVNYDHTLHVTPNVNSATVLPGPYRTGDFSSATAVVIDPLTHAPFPGNIIPQSRLDPAAVKIMCPTGVLPCDGSLMPLNNITGTTTTTDSSLNNFAQAAPYKVPSARYTMRLDHSIRSRIQMFASAERYLNPGNQPVIFNALMNPNYGKDNGGGWIANIGLTDVISSRIVAELHYGFTNAHDDHAPTGHGASKSDLENTLGIASIPENTTPEMAITGYTAFGAATVPVNNDSMTYIFNPSVTVALGRHTLKTGFGIRWNEYNSFGGHTAPQGYLTFTGEITNSTHAQYGGALAAADFMLGLSTTGLYEIPQPRSGHRNRNYSVFLQDDWRALPKLTFNLGLRYEYETPFYVSNNLYTRIDEFTGNLLAAGYNTDRYAGVTSPKMDFMPRVGFAYSVSPTLVLRGAYGVFYNGIMTDINNSSQFPGYDTGASYVSQGSGVPQPFTLSQGFPLTAIQDIHNPFAVLTGTGPSNTMVSFGTNTGQMKRLSRFEERNLGIQKRLPGEVVVELNYVGTHGIHLANSYDFNDVPLSQLTLAAQIDTGAENALLSPFPNLQTGLAVLHHEGDSNYNSLQVAVRKQFGARLSFSNNFTWAHSIDDASGLFNFASPNGLQAGQFPQVPALRRLDRSNSSFDVRYNDNLAIQFKTISRHHWLNGISISPVFVIRGGLPVNITQNNTVQGVATQRPNGDTKHLKVKKYVPGGAAFVQQFILPSAADFPLTPSGPYFVNVPAGTTGAVCSVVEPAGTACPAANLTRLLLTSSVLGNVSRNSQRGDGEQNLNMAVSRTFPLPKKATFQIRVDAFNVLNKTNFQNPSGATYTGTSGTGAGTTANLTGNETQFGAITGNYTPRYLQLNAKIAF